MSRIRSAGRSVRYPFLTGSISSAVSILHLTLSANKPILVRRLTCGAVSQLTNSQMETAWSLETGGADAGSPTTITGIVMDGDATAPSVVVKVGVTGETYDGTSDIERAVWPSLGGYVFEPPNADGWLYLAAGSGNHWGFRIKNTPGAASTLGGELEIMELVS